MKTRKEIHNLWMSFLEVNARVEEMENYPQYDGSPALANLINMRKEAKSILVNSIVDFVRVNHECNANDCERVLRTARDTDEYEGTDVLSCVELAFA